MKQVIKTIIIIMSFIWQTVLFISSYVINKSDWWFWCSIFYIVFLVIGVIIRLIMEKEDNK